MTATADQQHRRPPHVLVVTHPAQGHLNPALQFSTRLAALGCRVTLATTVSGHRRIASYSLPEGLAVSTFSDGYDDGVGSSSQADDQTQQWANFVSRGSQFVRELIASNAEGGAPFARLVYTPLLTWAMEAAREESLPATLLWIQPATVLDIYYYYFVAGYEEKILDGCKDPSFVVELPGLHVSFASKDLPSFLVPSNPYPAVLKVMKDQIEVLSSSEDRPKVLVNIFDALEPDALRALEGKLDMVGIGPLVDLTTSNIDDVGSVKYMTWLDSRATSSVVYVSFGTMAAVSRRQKEEVGKALLSSGRSFLWTLRKEPEKEEEEEAESRWREEMEKEAEECGGMIVEWCSQVDVLAHPAVGCFLTHCGWNSTLESMCLGVPMVGFPQFSDQQTNAKLVEDVWRTGVRVVVSENGGGDGTGGGTAVGAVVEGEEIRRCLELVMGEGEVGEEVRRNAKKWKELARSAAGEGGTSHVNLKAFVDEIASYS
ncbi:unnamed protein product [Linum tenue]|uniref:Glycosyltransferase n=4 Tax=Linum tenue TaxID=586396 RepID=A0AAV0S5I4_9ROSI|nr:unnamed protein product [Linum tenue]